MGRLTSWGQIFAWVGVATAAGGCSDGNGNDDTGTGTIDATPLVFLDSNNYAYTAGLTLESTDLKARADATVEWAALDTDYRGRPVLPAEITRVTLTSFKVEHDRLIDLINTNGLVQDDIDNYREAFPFGVTEVTFEEDFTVLGNDFVPADDFFADPDGSWLLTLWKTNCLGNYEIVSSKFVVPVGGESNTGVSFTNDSALLVAEIDLSSAPAIPTVADASPYALNWAALENDVNGVPFDEYLGDMLRISHLPVETAEEAEALLLQLDVAADQIYYLNVYASLSVPNLVKAVATCDGLAPFPGFTTDGIWLVGIECTSEECFSPAPLALAVVEVE